MKTHHGGTLDAFFTELGELEEVNALAAKKILAIQAQRRMRALGLTTTRLAERMHTSRNQVLRCLDPEDAGITLKVLFRLSHALEIPLRIGFEAGSKEIRPRPRARVAKVEGATRQAKAQDRRARSG